MAIEQETIRQLHHGTETEIHYAPVALTQTLVDTIHALEESETCASSEIAVRLGRKRVTVNDRISVLFSKFGIYRVAGESFQQRRERLLDAVFVKKYVLEYKEKPILTSREIKIITLRAKGLKQKGIAATLGISPGTVKNHFCNIFEALGANSAISAILKSVNLGLIKLEDITEVNPPLKPKPQRFSSRQSEILKMMENGMTSAEIAKQLGISVGTVKNHKTEIYKKLGGLGKTNVLIKAYKATKNKGEMNQKS